MSQETSKLKFKKVLWISDRSYPEYNGGAERTDYVIREAGKKLGLQIKWTNELPEKEDFDFIVISNIHLWPDPEASELLRNEWPTVFFSHDPLIHVWYAEAMRQSFCTVFMSPAHREWYLKKFYVKNYIVQPHGIIDLDKWYSKEPKEDYYLYIGDLNCYDNKTEILTENGFKFFKDLDKKERVATLNLETGNLEFKKPIAYFVYPFKGELIHFEGRNYDLKVTKNHRMLVRYGEKYKRNSRRWKVEKAIKVLRKIKRSVKAKHAKVELKRDSNWEGKDLKHFILPEVKTKQGRIREAKKLEIEKWLRFLGFYLSKGSLRKKNYRIRLAQTKFKKFFGRIFKDLEQMGFKPCFTRKRAQIEISNLQLYTYLKSLKKRIPKEIKNLNKKKLEILLNSLIKEDGDSLREIYYFSKSKGLAEDVAEIAIRLGYGVSISEYKQIFQVNLSKIQKTPIICKSPKIERYEGKIYDITVPNHLILVKRKGKIIWSGNSYKGVQNLYNWAKENPDKEVKVWGRNFAKFPFLLDNFKFYGFLPEEKVAETLAEAKYFIHLPNYIDPCPRMVTFAYLSGCTIIGNENIGLTSYDWPWDDPEKIKAILRRAPKEFWYKINKYYRKKR